MTNMQEITPVLKNASYPLESAATTRQLEEGHLKRLSEAGYKTVVDPRPSEEDRGLDDPEVTFSDAARSFRGRPDKL